MEHYSVKCTICKESYSFVDFKTTMYKTQEQVEGMRKRSAECKHCGGKLEHTDDDPSGIYKFAATLLKPDK